MDISKVNFILSYLFTGLILLFLGLIVLLKNQRNIINRTFILYCISTSWWCLFSIPMIIANSEFWGTFWDKICLFGVIFIPSTFIHFHYSLLNQDKKTKWFIYFNYLLSFILACTLFTPWMVITTAPNIIANYFTVPGPLYLLFVIYLVTISCLGILGFLKSMLVSKGIKKSQMQYLFWSTLIGYSGGLFNVTLTYNLGIPEFVPFGIYGVGIYGIIVFYAITKTSLMDIRIVIGKTLAHGLTILGFGTIYTIIVILYTTYISSKIDLPFYIITILLGILVGNLYNKVKDHIQTPADQFFIKSWYNFPKVITRISSAFAQINSRSQIVAQLSKILKEEIDVPDSNFFFLDKGTFVKYNKETFEPSPADAIKPQDEHLTKASQTKDIVFLEKNNPYQAILLVPVFNANNELIAFFTLGKKRSEETYTNKDLDLLHNISSQIFMSLEFVIKPYEEVKRNFDATEHKLAETEIMLARSARLASLATLTAGVTHEIRNPLAVIRSKTEDLLNKERDYNYQKECASLIIKHVDRIANIVDRMLDLSKSKEIKKTLVDLNNLIEEDVLPLAAAQNVTIIKQLNPIPKVEGVLDEFRQVVINLTNNAIIAMPKGGVLTYKTYLISEDNIEKVVIEVIDTGIGIPPENMEKIFNPFFSTRHEGIGLGLSISYKLVENHKGKIEVESKIGEGSTFRVILPVL